MDEMRSYLAPPPPPPTTWHWVADARAHPVHFKNYWLESKFDVIQVTRQNNEVDDLPKVSSSDAAEIVDPAGRTRRNPLLHSFRR